MTFFKEKIDNIFMEALVVIVMIHAKELASEFIPARNAFRLTRIPWSAVDKYRYIHIFW